MSRAGVRAAIQSYLADSSITSLGSVYAHPPKITPEGAFAPQDTPGWTSGAVIFIHLSDQHERRMTMGSQLGRPAAGIKFRFYKVSLVCVLRSTQADTELVGAANDAFVDSLVNAIESNRNAGAPGTVWQWGEGNTLGAPDIDVRAGMPLTLRQQISQVFTIVDVMAVEQVNS